MYFGIAITQKKRPLATAIANSQKFNKINNLNIHGIEVFRQMAEEYETKEVAYLIKEQDGKRRYLTNKPNHPEDATYNIQRRNARRLTGLEEINIQWDEHLIETETTVTKKYYKTYSVDQLKEVQDD